MKVDKKTAESSKVNYAWIIKSVMSKSEFKSIAIWKSSV